MNIDSYVMDTEQLNALADQETVKNGLAYFNENRVFELNIQPDRVLAFVEGRVKDYPYEVTLEKQPHLQSHCSCENEAAFCKHAIAVLYKLSEYKLNQQQEHLNSAVDEAIKERVKKGRNEVHVKLLKGNMVFGVWEARSIISATYRKTSYQVQIRSLNERQNFCTCPDLATNRLGTCKHIEAVLHYTKKQPDYQALKAQGVTIPFIYLAWESAATPVIKLQKAQSMEQSLSSELAKYFDTHNCFKGRLPDDFNLFLDVFEHREDIIIGADTITYVKQCSTDASHQLRAQHISQQILQSNGGLPGITARLFPYQIEGVAFLASRGRALLADDMGLGKTLQAISAAIWLCDNASVKKILVVCPASLKHQWAREINKFTNKKVQIIQGAIENRRVQYRADTSFFIINYELVLRDLTVINETLQADLLILDEAQRIKNWRTKIASTIKLIPSRYAFVLTGTPLENRIEDLYSLLQVIDPRILGPLWRCLLDYHVTDEKGKVVGYRNLSELRQRLSSVMLRRNRSLVQDQLPDKTQVRLDVAMSAVQQEIHDSAMNNAGRLADIAKKRPLTPSESKRMMAALQQARMACNAAGLVDKTTVGSPKLDELRNLLQELCVQNNRKAVIFSQWALMTEMVTDLLHELQIGYVRLHGGVPSNKRGALTESFEHDDAVQVFLSTDAGGVGLNLQTATVLINLDMPWNPAILDQRIARIHRLGQRSKVQIFLLLAEDSYEQRVAELVQGKRDLFDNVVDPDGTEDVVGVSKKMLETVIKDLGQPIIDQHDDKETQALKLPLEGNKPTNQEKPDDGSLNQLVLVVQEALKQRIERIMTAKGGLLVIVHYREAADDTLSQKLSDKDVPVVIITAGTYADLQRLGQSSPIAEAKTLFAAQQDSASSAANALLQSAIQKLQSAEKLHTEHYHAGIMELLSSALLSAAASLTQQAQIPSVENSAVWLYNEIAPRQLLKQEHINHILRIVALSQSPEVPVALIEQAMQDSREIIAYIRQ